MLVYCVVDSRSVSEPDLPSSCNAGDRFSVEARVCLGGCERREEEADATDGAGERV